MEYRVEEKYYVTDADLALIYGRLRQIMSLDSHQNGSGYEIRSLYFDDYWDRGMEEKSAGVDIREKYRIRIYNGSRDVIHLEKKSKYHGFTKKESCSLTQQEADRLISGSMPLQFDERKVLNNLLIQSHCSKMEPKAIIAYDRTALVYPAGNVRITFDRNIEAGKFCQDFFCPVMRGMTPLLPRGLHILEVKYDEFLPDVIRSQLEIRKLRKTAFSKYYLGRMALNGEFEG